MHRSPWVALVLLTLLWGAAASAQPGGTVTGAVQYRASSTTFGADDDIRIVSPPGFQLLNGKVLYVHQPTSTSNAVLVVDFGTAGEDPFTVFRVDGEPVSDAAVVFPVDGRNETPNVWTVLFREDLDSVGELSTRIGADSTAANRFLASPSGASGALSLRALANADLGGLSPTFAGLTLSTGTTNGLLYRNSSGAVVSSSGILANSGFLELKNNTSLKLTDPVASFLMQAVFTNPTRTSISRSMASRMAARRTSISRSHREAGHSTSSSRKTWTRWPTSTRSSAVPAIRRRPTFSPAATRG